MTTPENINGMWKYYALLSAVFAALTAILADSRFLPAYHMNKRTWFAIRLDGGVELSEILRLVECSRKQAVKR